MARSWMKSMPLSILYTERPSVSITDHSTILESTKSFTTAEEIDLTTRMTTYSGLVPSRVRLFSTVTRTRIGHEYFTHINHSQLLKDPKTPKKISLTS